MALLDELKADQLAARKVSDRLKADLLTTLIGEATQITTEEFKRGVTEVTDEKVVATVAKFLKNTKLTLENLAAERAHWSKPMAMYRRWTSGPRRLKPNWRFYPPMARSR